MNRRDFLKTVAATTATVALATDPAISLALKSLKPIPDITNPLEHYPPRDWEQVYRDVYTPDSSYIFTCTPNDTHNCYLRAYVKNGIVTRIGPSQRYRDATDIYSTKASARWDPRICNKGIAIVDRFYGDRRVKHPTVRKGYKEWVEKGFPRDANGQPPQKYFKRGEDQWVKVSWDEAYTIIAKSMVETASAYSGAGGAGFLKKQGSDATMIERMKGAGTQTMKFRGGMPLLGVIKLFGLYRMANSMALLDSHVRGVGRGKAIGGMGFDNYSWHTDLPPGHPMVTGQQTIDFDLVNAEYANIILCWGMNWICTKMPDGHWLSEARLKGARVVSITTDYNCTSHKSDELLIIRPGTDPALALGLAHVIIKEKLYDEKFVKGYTDLPFLVRMDNRQLLRAGEVIKGYKNAKLKHTRVLKKGEKIPPFATNVGGPAVNQKMRQEWGDFVLWDAGASRPAPVTRDDTGERFEARGIDPALEGTFEVKLTSGKKVKVRPIFDVIKQHIMDTWDPESTSKVTWAPKDAIFNLARQIAANPEKVLFTVGMGPNQMFNADQKDRTIFLVASLTRNVGFLGGNVGSYAGNYRAALFNGMPQYIAEDPFNITLDPEKSVKIKPFFKMQSAHFYAHGDTPLKVHGRYFNGKTHTPTPTKFFWFAGSNSILGNAKGKYDIVMNLVRNRKIESIVVNEWWWSASCEYADVVLPVDSWGEYNVHDLTASVTNPFVMAMPLTGIPRIWDTRSDTETYAAVSEKLAELTGDRRFKDYWHFIADGKARTYLQRIIDHCNTMKGFKVDDLIKDSEDGVPALLMSRTYPKYIGYDQSEESAPWYNKTGRLEFYREEPEFQEHGENLPLHREPVDATFYEPNVIVARKHPLIKPKTPADYGWPTEDLSGETRQVRNVIYTPEELLKTEHPLRKDGFTHIYLTPKLRHAVHTFGVDLAVLAVWFGPFGDMYRRDKRKPWVNEGFVEMNPEDARELGFEDGDYVWVDPDPEDRPFKGWQKKPADYKVARCLLRARYHPGLPRGVTRTWFNMYQATHGSVRGHETRKDGLARNPDTNYQSMFRYGGHQSSTRSWLRPTLLTDTMVRKNLMGQVIGKGFVPDVHCANGAPRESFVKFTKKEDGGESGTGKWRPARLGFRLGYENDAMKKYLKGGFISKGGE
jgi:nitrate reductase alpha subunit